MDTEEGHRATVNIQGLLTTINDRKMWRAMISQVLVNVGGLNVKIMQKEICDSVYFVLTLLEKSKIHRTSIFLAMSTIAETDQQEW